MAKTIAVTGATGVQGGSVARKMLEEGWTVRAITRNTTSDAAKKLAEQGAEVVQASFDDESSLVKAFEVYAPSPGRPPDSVRAELPLLTPLHTHRALMQSSP